MPASACWSPAGTPWTYYVTPSEAPRRDFYFCMLDDPGTLMIAGGNAAKLFRQPLRKSSDWPTIAG